MKQFKRFPIQTDTACQLKWSHSTVFLTTLTTASCHRVNHNKFDLDTFNFHNTEEKLRDRKLMLEGKWPGHGCEHCKNIEDSGGTSDRMLHLDFHGYRAPPEIDKDLTAINVSPRQLEIYFSNTCNLKCIYCSPKFSSQINDENKRFGKFHQNGVDIPNFASDLPGVKDATDKMFDWLDNNIQNLDQLLVLGGEPFIQKETHRLLDFLLDKNLSNLDLVIFSNLTIEHNRFVDYIEKIKKIKNVNQVQIIGSIDCWGSTAEYLRNGLDLELFNRNFTYLVEQTDIILSINSTMSVLSIPDMPELVRKINDWSAVRTIYWSLMKVGGRPYLHPTVFGPQILDLGYTESIDVFDTFNDPEKMAYKEYFVGIGKELGSTAEDKKLQSQLKTYLVELDRRRGTDYKSVFPSIANLLEKLDLA